MSKTIRWLYDETERWVREQIIDPGQAEAIKQLYPEPKPVRPWAMIIFSGLGAIIVVLGIILLFAYNWQAMPKAAKLFVILMALVAAHGSGIYLFSEKPQYKAIGESLTVGGTMLFGAGIWLIAQIYHIDEHFPNAFILWGMGALLMAWALPSAFQGIIAAVLLTVWAGAEAGGFNTPIHVALPLVVGSLLPLAYKERSRVLLACVLVATGIILCFLVDVTGDEEAILLVLLAVAVLACGLAQVHRIHGRAAEFAPVYHILGLGTYLFLLYLLTFGDITEHILELAPGNEFAGWLYCLLPIVLALGVWAYVALRYRGARGKGPMTVPVDLWLLPVTALTAYIFAAFLPRTDEMAQAGVFNLVFLAHVVSIMSRGVLNSEVRSVALGALLLIALTAARYADLFHSLIVRGLVFVAVGAALFTEGVCYARGKRQKEETQCASG